MPEKPSPSEVAKLLDKAFKKAKKQHLTAKQFLDNLPGTDLKTLGLKKSSKAGEVIKALGNLPSPYSSTKKGVSPILLAAPLENIFQEAVRLKPGLTIGQIGAKLPLAKSKAIVLANDFLKSGALRVELNKDGLAKLFIADQSLRAVEKPKQAEPSKAKETTPNLAAFKSAYDKVGKGARFVFIYKIRRELDWPREVFDLFLDNQMVQGRVVAYTGNPGALNRDEVMDSYQNEIGELYITVMWRDPS